METLEYISFEDSIKYYKHKEVEKEISENLDEYISVLKACRNKYIISPYDAVVFTGKERFLRNHHHGQIIKDLVGMELIEEVEDRSVLAYHVTEKGKDVLRRISY